MLRFDSEVDLGSHELGRSLLFMIRDEDGDLDGLPSLHRIERPSNPFEVVRERLAAVTLAIQELQPQVHAASDYIGSMQFCSKNSLSIHINENSVAILHSAIELLCNS